MQTRPFTTMLAALVLAGLLAGCGGDGGTDDAGPAGLDEGAAAEDEGSGSGEGGDEAGEAEFRDAALDYAQCMRDHGIDMPDPEVSAGDGGEMAIQLGEPGDGPSSGGPGDEEFAAAEEECRPIMDAAVPEREPIDPEELAERQDQAVALAQCMRDRGYDFPDPQVNEDGGIAMQNEGGTGMAPGDAGFEDFEADMAECHEEAGMELPDGDSGLSDGVEGNEGGGA